MMASWPNRPHLQSSMLYPCRPQMFQARPQLFCVPQRQGIVSTFPHHFRGIMANIPEYSSFFVDEMYYYRDRDEQPAFREQWQPALQTPAPVVFPFRPLLPTDGAVEQVAKVDSNPSMPTPGVLASNVNARKYSHISDDDWACASIDYETSSPSTVATDADQPMTPGINSNTSGSFSFAGSVAFTQSSSFSSQDGVAPTFEDQHQDAKLIVPSVPQTALPAPYQMAMPVQYPLTEATAHHRQTGTWTYPLPVTTMPGHMLAAPPPSQATPVFIAPSVDDYAGSEYSESADGELTTAPEHVRDSVYTMEEKDRFLLEGRKKGMSYRKIRAQGRFQEAESTLRGRHRMLTKHKNHRLRKAPWTDNDITLLHDAVQQNSPNNPRIGSKLPWKRIGEWMVQNGSSYPFGAGTLAKKWAELNGR